jgi:hypothetical protein
MTALVPVGFPAPTENVIASYSYTDVANGTGISIFYGADTFQAAAIDYHLVPTVVYSQTENPALAAVDQSSFTKEQDNDYDLSAFNLPRTIKGEALVSITQYLTANATGTTKSYIYAKIRKWDGTTETEIASASGAILTVVGAGWDYATDLIRISVPSTDFKKDETLRLTIEQYAKYATAEGMCTYGHDPKNRKTSQEISGADVSILEFHCPFRIDL